MVRPGRDRLSGRVEVDETYLGGLEEGLCGRQICNKALIVVAAEEDGRATGRIRMRRIDSPSGKDLHGFVVEAIEKGSMVHTDGWRNAELNKKKKKKYLLCTSPKNGNEGIPLLMNGQLLLTERPFLSVPFRH